MLTFKTNFFAEPQRLKFGIDRAAYAALSRFGSFVRQRDRSSLRYRKKPSVAGGPPSVHRSEGFTRKKKNRKTGQTTRQATSPLRELTFFAYDPSERSVVIGPAIFRSSKVGGGKAPKVIEEGGIGPVFSDGKRTVGRYTARPHTGPAFRAELPRAAELFKGQIR